MNLMVTTGTTIAIVILVHTIINGILLRRPVTSTSVDEPVAILIPCRNEAANIVDLVETLRAQRGLSRATIIFLDDHSTDDTRARIQQEIADQTQMRLIAGASLPQGWLGKPFACQQLADAAPDATALVFIDADVRLAPDAVSQAVATLRSLNVALVSPYPRQISHSWSERLLQPLLQWSWLATLPLRWAERSTRPSLAAANGQFLVVDAQAYRASGGHAAIRDQVLDDIRMLQHFKTHGYRGIVIDGSTLATCRMYSSWDQVRTGYTKWLWSAFGSRTASVAVALLLALAFVLPPTAALTGSLIGLVGYLAAVLGRMVTAVRSGDRLVDALWHPLSIALLIVLIALSWRGRARGSLTWKERTLS